jgi:hypothetical protein
VKNLSAVDTCSRMDLYTPIIFLGEASSKILRRKIILKNSKAHK